MYRTIYCNHRVAATFYTLESWFVPGNVIVNTCVKEMMMIMTMAMMMMMMIIIIIIRNAVLQRRQTGWNHRHSNPIDLQSTSYLQKKKTQVSGTGFWNQEAMVAVHHHLYPISLCPLQVSSLTSFSKLIVPTRIMFEAQKNVVVLNTPVLLWENSSLMKTTYVFVCLFLARQPHSGPGSPHSRGF